MQPLPGRNASRQYYVIYPLIRALMSFLFRVTVSGQQHVPTGPYVVVSNHNNWLDPFLLARALPMQPRLWVLGAEDIIWNSPMKQKFFSFTGGVVPIDRRRSAADRAAIAAMRGVLERGGAVGLFPEGGIGFYEGRIRTFKHGAALIALQAGVPLLPVGISGTSDLWFRKRITVRIGPPVTVGTVDPREAARSRTRQMTVESEKAVRSLIDPPGRHSETRGPKLLRRFLNPWAHKRPAEPFPEPTWVTDASKAPILAETTTRP